MALARGMDGGVDRGRVGDVGETMDHAVVGGGRGLAVEADDGGAFVREQARGGRTDAAGGAGDQGDLAGQATFHGHRLPWAVDAAMAAARGVPSDCGVAMGPSSRR